MARIGKLRGKTRPITQHDVAAAAGCSQNTVALALRDSPRISEQRRQQVHEIARRLGYRPNLAARSLRQRRSGLIGIFGGSLDEVRAEYVRQLVAELHSTEYKPIFGIDLTRPSPWYKAPWIETFRMMQVEALIALSWADNVEVPPWHQEIPMVLAGCQPQPELPCDYVGLDRIVAGRQATEYLLQRGHQRVLMLQHSARRLITEGYERTMLAAGFTPHVISITHNDQAGLAEFWPQFAALDPRPTALVVLNSALAAQLCRQALERGLRIPQDLAVLGYDRLSWAESAVVPLTTLEQPVSELVERTIGTTRQRVAEPSAPPVHITLEHQLVVRGTT